MKLLIRCFLIVVLCLMSTAISQAQDILVKEAWVRGVPPSAKSTAAFMTIQNMGSADMVFQSAGCDIAEIVQIHTMEQVGEVMKMKTINELRVPAKGQTSLAPKGYHLMLIGLLRSISEGEVVPLRLNFSDGSIVKIDAVVRKWGPMSHMSH